MLGLPACSNSQWNRIMTKLEVHVTKLAELSCSEVVQVIRRREEGKPHLMASIKLGVIILTIVQQPFMTTQVVR